MIAACPKCDARYRVDESKVGPEGARLRCAKCQAVFRVGPPAADSSPQLSVPIAPDATTQSPAAPAVGGDSLQSPGAASDALGPPAQPGQGQEIEYDRERLVLVADPKDESGKLTVGALTSWGLQPLLVPDGVEAMLAIQRLLPRIVVLDAALPKMYGFQVCEIVKRNESLRDTKVVLIGSIHNRDRYRRPPTEIYGADHYLEQPDMPDGLRPLLVQWGMSPTGDSPTTDVQPTPQASAASAGGPASFEAAAAPPQMQPAAPSPQPVAPEPAAAAVAEPQPQAPAAGDGLDEAREKAERLARIVVSDIVLYQAEKFEEGILTGNLVEILDAEIEEGRNFFRQRIDEKVRGERDHLLEELMRVATERGMQ